VINTLRIFNFRSQLSFCTICSSATLMIDRLQRSGVLRFGIFELELGSNELRKGGVLVKLQLQHFQLQHFQLLALLAERAGQIVSRDEIRRALWDTDTFVDFDRSINFSK
jgi:DNA-binding response OmpR family regulator